MGKGIKIINTEKKNDSVDLKETTEKLFSELNCYYVLCEGGGKLAESLIKAHLVDEIFFICSTTYFRG